MNIARRRRRRFFLRNHDTVGAIKDEGVSMEALAAEAALPLDQVKRLLEATDERLAL